MARPAFVVVVLLALGAMGVLGYFQQSGRKSPGTADHERGPDAKSAAPGAALLSQHTASETEPVVSDAGSPQRASLQPVSPETFAQWIADASSDDSRTRAAAIVALAEAPKSQAVPVLENILQVGEPQVDRQIALRSLHTLALQQGDTDGSIRDVLRRAVYHGDDEGASQSAQAVLEDIEIEFSETGTSD